MSNVSELVEIGHRAKRLIELLESARLSALDFDNRQHLQVIQLSLDMAIDRAEKIGGRERPRPGRSSHFSASFVKPVYCR